MERDTKNINIRIPANLHARLVILAGKEKRSINGQLLAIIEKATEGIKTEPEKAEATA